MTLSGTNTFTALNVDEGTLKVHASENLGAEANLTLKGTLLAARSMEIGRPIKSTGSTESTSGTIETPSDVRVKLAGTLSCVSGDHFNKEGPGTLVLAGDSSGFVGDLHVKEGVLVIDKNKSLASAFDD